MVEKSPERHSLEELNSRLRAARDREDAATGRAATGRGARLGQGIGMAFRISVELVAGLAVGLAIGYGLDRWLGTRPWLMVVFFFLGAAAGILNVYRAATGMDSSVGFGAASRRRDRER